MFSYLFSQLMRSVGVFLRTIRAFFRRQTVGLASRLRSLTIFSRYATRVASESLQGAVTAAQKPTKREDFVETRRLFISKALLLKLALITAALALILYFLVWPFVLSHFLTARFYVEDRRVADWSGKAVVYSDREKKKPLYAGRLVDGLLQGEGKYYDENGLLLYEGQLADGLRSGRGTAYSNGILSYQGQFSDDLYEGSGTIYDAAGFAVYEGQFARGLYEGTGRLFSKGVPVYDGQFSRGVYNGQGKRYADGVPDYEGSFINGVPEGSGSGYHPNGKLAYKGQFAAGLPDGSGSAYDETGRLLYEGGFSEGLYSGAGHLYPSSGQELEASFANGEPEGVVRWKKNGQLYFDGEWSQGQPNGFGKLYNKAGSVIYAGYFSAGTIDGDWLLDLSTEELREVLGDGQTRNLERSQGGFLLSARELGLTALCSFQSEDASSQVYAAYLTCPPGEAWVQLMPGMDTVTLSPETALRQVSSVTMSFTPPEGVDVAAGTYAAQTFFQNDSQVIVLFPEGEKVASLVSWTRGEAVLAGLSAVTGSGSASGGSDKRMERFLGNLGLVKGDESFAVGSASANPYLGAAAPGPLLRDSGSPDKAAALADAMASYWEQAERQVAFEESLTRTELLLNDARKALAQGTGSQEAVDALEEQQLSLQDAIQSCITQRAKAQLIAQGAGGPELSGYDLSGIELILDPAALDANSLALVAAAYAQSVGSPVSDEGLAVQVRSVLLDLVEAYGGVQTALAHYEAGAQRSQSAAAAYAKGEGSKEAWYQSLSGQSDCRAALVSQLASFTRVANALNQMTGGWISRSYGWFAEEFGAVFQEAMDAYTRQQEEEEAQEEPDEPAQTEAPADPEEPVQTEVPAYWEEPAQTEAPEYPAEPEQTELLDYPEQTELPGAPEAAEPMENYEETEAQGSGDDPEMTEQPPAEGPGWTAESMGDGGTWWGTETETETETESGLPDSPPGETWAD